LYNSEGVGSFALRPFTGAALFMLGISVAIASIFRGRAVLGAGGLAVTILAGFTIVSIPIEYSVAGPLVNTRPG